MPGHEPDHPNAGPNMTIHVHGGPRAFQLAATIGVTLLSACSGASRERAPLNIDHPLVPLVLSPGSGALQPLHAAARRLDARAVRRDRL
jgi:hypothetical protein